MCISYLDLIVELKTTKCVDNDEWIVGSSPITMYKKGTEILTFLDRSIFISQP